jgi:hypothetical protein
MNRTSALALILGALTAAPALALTPEEVWAMWQRQTSAQGQALTAASAVRAGDTLVLSGVVSAIAPEGGEFAVRGEIGSVLMRELDGTVEITLADSYPITISGEGLGSAVLRVAHPGLVMTAEGEDGAIGYAFAAPSLSITLESFEAPEPFEASFAITFAGIEGSYATSGTDEMEIGTDFAAKSMTLTVAARDPGAPGRFNLEWRSEDIAITGGGVLVPGTGAADELPALLQAGMIVEADYAFGATSVALDAADESGAPVRANVTFAATSFGAGLAADAISYSTLTEGLSVLIAGGDMPFPELSIMAAEFGLGFLVPMAAADEAQDASLVFRLVDLELPDDLWSMGDPMGQLQRGPITAILDASGLVKVLVDFLNPEAMEGMAPPVELEALEISELQLKAAGADLTGAGSFTFDNTDLESFDGLPRPAGALDLRLVGGNALLDTLAAMGMIPPDQMMGARMMLGLFARPGDGPDTLVSRIEVTPDGAVLANGQRIR